MKRILLLILAFILVACSKPATGVSTPTEIAVSTETVAEAAIAHPTATSTQTLVPPTSTLDLIHLPTSTSQPAAACPAINEKLRISLGSAFKNKKAPYHDARTVVLNFLNEGGNPKTAIEKLAEHNVFARLLDLTHDGVPELTLPSGYFTVFGCQGGKYVNLLDIAPAEDSQMTAVPLTIEDLNQNGIVELLIGQVQARDLTTYRIFEWDGQKFANITPTRVPEQNTKLYVKNQAIHAVGQSNAEKGALEGNWEVKDADSNGLKDIVIHAGVYDNPTSSSSLENSLVLKWDGKSYAVAGILKEATPTNTPTSTPLPFSETCSIKNSQLRYQKPDGDIRQSILDYLNAGGIPEKLDGMTYHVTVRDLNNDTAPEIIVDDFSFPDFIMFTCQHGRYKETVTPRIQRDVVASFVEILTITDNNKNGFPEVFVKAIGCIAWECGGLYVVEWDGDHFAQKLKGFDSGSPVDYTRMDFPRDAYLKDLDGDGIAELIWRGEILPDWHGDHWTFYPQRLATHAFKWDGTNYTAQLVEYSTPKYRFQAVQDGDRYSNAGLYEKALRWYQQAITSDSLEWWTEDLHNSIMASHQMGPCAEKPSDCPVPTKDPSERPILSAYASFRMAVVYLLMNNPQEAEATYQRLIADHPQNSPAYPVAEMATAFWNEYQSTQDIAQACARSVGYIKTQQNVLIYLTGSDNSQGINYDTDPTQVCPFK